MEKELLFFKEFDPITKQFFYEGGLPGVKANRNYKINPKAESVEFLNSLGSRAIFELSRSEIKEIVLEDGKLAIVINRNNERNTLHFASKHRDSAQILADVKSNLESFWQKVDKSSNPNKEIEDINNKIINGNKKKAVNFLIILLVLGAFYFLIKDSSCFGSSSNACQMSEEYVKMTLNYPDDASMSFLDCHSEEKGNGTYRVLRKVKAKNAFGMSKSYIYEIVLKYKGGEKVDENNWELISIRHEEEK